jgi:hypothetical protein
MNTVGKTISITLYLTLLIITRIVAPQAMAPVALTGIAAFFIIHLSLRATRRRRRTTSPDHRDP